MAKLSTIAPRLASAPAKVQAAGPASVNYGKGRGGRPWRRKRDAVLARDKHLCQPCLQASRYTQATEVDHITPQAEGGTDDLWNLQAICGRCHEAKTKAEAQRGITRGR